MGQQQKPNSANTLRLRGDQHDNSVEKRERERGRERESERVVAYGFVYTEETFAKTFIYISPDSGFASQSAVLAGAGRPFCKF